MESSSESAGQNCLRKKSLVPDCNTHVISRVMMVFSSTNTQPGHKASQNNLFQKSSYLVHEKVRAESGFRGRGRTPPSQGFDTLPT